MKRVITIGGLHGTGKSSVADAIAKKFNLRRTSAGVIFRRLAAERDMSLEEFSRIAEKDAEIDRLLDSTLKEEARKGDVVLDGQLAAFMAGDHADLRILLTAPLDVRAARIADRDSSSFEYAKRQTIAREGSERARYQEYYDVDVSDMTIYDIVLNTAKYDLDGVVRILCEAISIFFEHNTRS